MPRVICPNCSNAYTPAAGGGERCPRCGYSPGAATPVASAAPQWSSGGASTFTPVLAPPGPSVLPPGHVAPSAPVQPTNGFAVTSMVLGIVAFPTFVMGVVLAPLALIFGIVAATQVKKRNQKGFGMAVAGIILGSVWLVLAFFLFTLVAGFV